MDFMTVWFLCFVTTTTVATVLLFRKKPKWVARALDSGPRSDLAVTYGVMIPVTTICFVASIPLAYLLVLLLH